MFLEPHFNTDLFAQPAHGIVGRKQEEIKSEYEKYGIDDTRYQDPFPQPVHPDEPVCFGIGLDGYNNFFEQIVDLTVNIA